MDSGANCGEFRLLTEQEVAGATAAQRRIWGQLVFEAFPQFYRLVPLDKDAVSDILGGQIAMPNTELKDTYCLSSAGEDVAILSAVSSKELSAAMRMSAIAINRKLGEAGAEAFASAVKGFSARVEPLTIESIYISRLAVLPSAQRTGAGRTIVTNFIALKPHETYTLHARADNEPVVDFYKKIGFQFVSSSSHPFRIMAYRT